MTLNRYIKKLRLKPGDIVLVRGDFPINRIVKVSEILNLKFQVPIIFSKQKSDIRKMPFEELERIYLMAKEAKCGL